MKKVTVFAEKSIEMMEDKQKEFLFRGIKGNYIHPFQDGDKLVTVDRYYRIHLFRKAFNLSPMEILRNPINIVEDLKQRGFVEAGSNSFAENKVFIKEKHFIVMDEDLDDIIASSLENRKQDDKSLNLEALKSQADRLNKEAGKYFNQCFKLDKLTKQSVKILEEIKTIPWYKRIFGWNNKINKHILYMRDNLNRVFDEN